MKMIEFYAKKELFNLIMHATDTFLPFATLTMPLLLLQSSTRLEFTSEDGSKREEETFETASES